MHEPSLTLNSENFTEKKCTQVAGFSCGETRWAEYLNEWISGEGFKEALKRKSKVFLYYLGPDLVGYGSIGETRISWPWPTGERQKVSIIPAIAVSKNFQGKPETASFGDRFSGQIMRDLLSHAQALKNDKLVLHVHCQNKRAQKFYENFGFEMAGDSSEDQHLLMVLKMSALIVV